MTIQYGLQHAEDTSKNFLKLEDGQNVDVLFIDWHDRLGWVKEHYEATLNPRYVRCPGKEVCPLCKANPGKYPSTKAKFRVWNLREQKVQIVNLSKKHIQSLVGDCNLDQVDPTQVPVRIYRSGKTASDTRYSLRKVNDVQWQLPDLEAVDMPDIVTELTPHTPEEIQGFLATLMGQVPQAPEQGYQAPPANHQAPPAYGQQPPAYGQQPPAYGQQQVPPAQDGYYAPPATPPAAPRNGNLPF